MHQIQTNRNWIFTSQLLLKPKFCMALLFV
ncbi:hypothetical protein F383_07099 [Gossypium arboreum]|uniref:Uncharacterized protein n=1 Tax=Gossypium arboreum TaxID=29729 RepID=A0A0B0PGA1_GOSAR|nr:hypothetical protein F383_07099 [Gossypium arboreum]